MQQNGTENLVPATPSTGGGGRRLLCICYDYPPDTSPTAIRTGKLLARLARGGWAIDVVTAEARPAAVGHAAVRTVPPPHPSAWTRWLTRARLSKLLELTRRVDDKRAWVAPATAAAMALVAEHRPAAVVVFMMPYSAGLVALDLKRRTGLPVLMNFDDSPTCSDMHVSFPTAWHHRRTVAYEDALVAGADALVYVSRRTLERVRDRQPAGQRAKFHLVRYGADPADFAAAPADPPVDPPAVGPADATFRIVYTGGLTGWFAFDDGRTGVRRWAARALAFWNGLGQHVPTALDLRGASPVFVARAAQQVMREDPSVRVRVEVYGNRYPAGVVNAVLAREGVADVVRLHGPVPHGRAVELARSADLLFMTLPDRVDGSPGGRISAKTYEYLMTDRPILAALPPGRGPRLPGRVGRRDRLPAGRRGRHGRRHSRRRRPPPPPVRPAAGRPQLRPPGRGVRGRDRRRHVRVGHHCDRIWAPGGIATYVRRASDWQRAHGDEVVFLTSEGDDKPTDGDGRVAEPVAGGDALLGRAAELRLDVLHTYLQVDADLARSPVPVVRTVMGHQPYCPSGSRFFKRWERACDRPFTVAGCTWGHLVDRCGSVRPNKLLDDLRRTRVEERSLRGVRVIAISEFVRSQMIRDGYDPATIDLLHLPIRHITPAARADGGRPRVLYAGRLATEKGVGWLLRAMARTTADVVLDVAGTGDAEAELRALVADLGLGGRVTFLGWVDEAGVDRLMAGTRAAVFPSLWHEPFGLVAVEAMAHGVPVIGSRVGGIPETVRDGHNGLLVDANDVPGLAAAIDRLAADPALATRLGAAGQRDAAERFGLDDHMQQLAAVYAKAIASRR